MAEASEPPAATPGGRKKGCGCWLRCLLYTFILLVLLGIAAGPMTGSISHARAAEAMFSAGAIADALNMYAADHSGNYPAGKSSTEIFQKLIDDGYVTDPSLLRGRSQYRLVSTQEKLKPENVGFDVTVPVDEASPGDLPVVFLTGYKITYTPGASALPLSSAMKDRQPCMAVAYKNQTIAWFLREFWTPSLYYSLGGYQGQDYVFNSEGTKLGGKVLSDGTITNFIPSDFDSKGKTYAQLTPDGPLSP